MIYRALSWLLILFACFYGIGSYPLLDDNEGLYATIARDMLRSGHYIIPHLNGLPYLEKPPMLYWLMAGSMALFGINEGAAHLVPALAVFLTASCMYRFTRHVTHSEQAGFTAALLLVTSMPILAMGRMILCDMIMTCFLTCALTQFYLWHSGAGRRGLVLFYGFLACAVLTKGFVTAILAGGTIAVFLRWQRIGLTYLLNLLSVPGIVLFIAITAPWHIAASLQEPGFAWFYFVNEHLYRFLNKRQPHDYYTGPIWYYLPRLVGYLQPWTLFLLILLKKPPANAQQHLSATRFLWSWFLFCLCFFSLSGGKANYYLIVATPPLAMLLAVRLKIFAGNRHRIVRSLAASGLLVVIATVCVVRHFCNESSGDLYDTCQAISWRMLAWTIAYAALAIFLCWRVAQRWLPLLLGATVLLLLPLLISGLDLADQRISQKTVANYLKQSGYSHVAIYEEFEELSGLAFYLDNPLIIVDSLSSDLLYGQKQNPDNPTFMTLAQWVQHDPPLPLILLKQRMGDVTDQLQRKHVNMEHICIVKRFERVALINVCNGEAKQ